MTTFAAVDPRTGQPSSRQFADASADEVAAAVGAAVEATPVLREASIFDIARLLDTCASELESAGEEIVAVADRETALGLPRLQGELVRTTVQLRAFAGLVRTGRHLDVVIDHADASWQPTPRPDLRRMNVPVGPVAVFGASNFPLAFSVPGGDTASALAAGCPVVVKAHPSHPETSELCAAALRSAVASCGLPSGVFGMVHGAGHAVGAALVTADGIEAVGFTGSTAGGRALFDLAARRPRPIPVYAEMGSVNPVFVTPSALGGRGPAIAAGLASSATLGMGQFCTKPGLVFVAGDDIAVESFVASLIAAVEELAPGCMLDPRLRDAFAAEVAAVRAVPGVDVWEGRAGDGALSCGAVVAVVSLDELSANEALRREHFGPMTTVVRCPSESALIEAAGAIEGSLTATLHAEVGTGLGQALVAALTPRVGRLVWGGWPTGVAVTDAMVHGGPYPATSASGTTSVGLAAARRFLRPVAFQDLPGVLLPLPLRDDNPLGVEQRVNGVLLVP